MFKRILVPLDGSQRAECTVPHALALAQLADATAPATIVLLHVLEEPNAQNGVDPMEWYLRKTAAQAYMDGLCDRLRGMGVHSNCLLLGGSPAERIVEQVGKLEADVIVISSHGQSGRTDWSLGAVARKLLERAGVSVLLVHAEQDMAEMAPLVPAHYRRVLVPLDGSRRAECTLPIADRMARIYDAELVLAHVVQRPTILGWAMLSDDDRVLAEQVVEHTWTVAERYLDQVRARRDAPTQSALARADNVGIELDRLVEQHQVDLVLASAHGAASNPFRCFGDTVNSVLAYVHRPVLIYQDRPVAYTGTKAAPEREKLVDVDNLASLAA